MTIKIVTDSTSDLPQSLIDSYDITVIPVYINMGERSLKDGIDITRQEFYEQLPLYNPPPTTSAPGIGTFAQVYQRLADDGADAVISVHISAKLSNIVNVARLAVEGTQPLPVTVIDSGQLTLGTGLITLEAAKAAAQGLPLSEITALVDALKPRVHTVAAVETLTFLQRSGRLSRFQALMGALLRVKPLLSMNADVINMERARTWKSALQWVLDRVRSSAPFETLAMVHTNAIEKVQALGEQVAELFPQDSPTMCVNVTPAIGAHIGPGVVGFTFVTTHV
ncbi:MAG: DegV family protein [Anaerolineae bacterium]|nr:DegV family protein [Anaerolineae bacterium]